MARAHAIWILTESTFYPVAAFTVKHELVTFLDKQPNPDPTLKVIRVVDRPFWKTWEDGQISAEPEDVTEEFIDG